MAKFEFNLSMDELEKRTNKDYLIKKKFLKADAPEYLALANGDKKALVHLCNAAEILEKINMQLDCKHNLEVKTFLEEESAKGNKQAIIAAGRLDTVQMRIANIVKEFNREEEPLRKLAYAYVDDDKIIIE